jgi:hypothetical protein
VDRWYEEGEACDTSIEETKARLANNQEHQTEHGFSRWIVLDRHLRRPIEDSGLLALQEYGWIDLGFRLRPTTVRALWLWTEPAG